MNPVERTKNTLKTVIAQFCEEDQRKWDRYLQELTFALNTDKYDSTVFSPDYLNLCCERNKPKALYRNPKSHDTPEPSEKAKNEPHVSSERYSKHLSKLKEMYDLVCVHLKRVQANQSRNYNIRHREWRCNPGDRAMKR